MRMSRVTLATFTRTHLHAQCRGVFCVRDILAFESFRLVEISWVRVGFFA